MRRWLAVVVFLAMTAPAFADDDDNEPPEPPPAERLTWAVNAGVSWSSFGEVDTVSSPYLAGELGYRTSLHDAVGVRLEWSRLTGVDNNELLPAPLHYTFQPIFLGGFARGEALDRLWGEVSIGLALDHYADETGGGWSEGVGIGVTGGADVVIVDGYRIGLFAAAEGELEGSSHQGTSLGVAVRR